ncbi:MAG: hypothetical protein ACKVRP_09880 [Bacteroidota bacterium]
MHHKIGSVSVSIQCQVGREVMTLVDGEMEAGVHSVRFDGSELASGIYIG